MGGRVDDGDWTEWLGEQPRSIYVVLAVGTLLRLFALGKESYWLDEVASLNLIANRTLTEVLVQVPVTDRHPPLYYAILKVWTGLFGVSEAVTRTPAALFGIASLVLVYLVAIRLYDQWVGVVSTTLVAFSTFHLGLSQNTRMYSLLAFTTLLSYYFLVRLLETQSRTNYAGYVVSTVLLGYTHAFGLFMILAQNAYVVWARLAGDERTPSVGLGRWLVSQVLVGVLLLPWVGLLAWKTFLSEGGPEGLAWIDPPTVATLVDTFGSYFNSLYPLLGMLVLAAITVFAIADWAMDRFGVGAGSEAETLARDGGGDGRTWTPLVVCWVAVPLVVPLALSYLVTPIFVPRYTVASALGFFVLFAAVIRSFRRPSFRMLALMLLLMVLVVGLPGYYGSDQYEQWSEVASYIEGSADGDDLVLLTDSYVRKPFNYYYSVPNETVTRIAVPDTLPPEEIRRRTAGHDTVWLVVSNSNASNTAKFNSAIGHNYSLAESRNYIGVDIIKYQNRSARPRNETATNASSSG